jgi:acyl dehydratase
LAGLSSNFPHVATLALISLREWSFEHPIFFGDSVRSVTVVKEVARHGRRAGRVTWLRELVNQDGRVVQRGIFITLVATQTRSQVRSPRPASVEAIAPAPAELG